MGVMVDEDERRAKKTFGSEMESYIEADKNVNSGRRRMRRKNW